MSTSKVLLGAIADDFTGATDLANTWVQQGMRVTLVFGVPDATTEVGDAEAIIVALKSRTEPATDAISESLVALHWLNAKAARQYFFKYCSTFDSTPAGNIGPVADALMHALDCDFAFVCPAFPTNGRTVYQGNLFVDELLLSESSMKDHPLTPMRDASLIRLMDAQSTRTSGLIPLQQVRLGSSAVASRVALLKSQGHSYGIIDAVSDDDLRTIGIAAAQHKLVTGGSGVAIGLPANLHDRKNSTPRLPVELPTVDGGAIVLAGSCSSATRKQIAALPQHWPQRKLDVDAAFAGDDVATSLADWAKAQDRDIPIVIYASANPDEVALIQQRYGVDNAGATVERIMGALAQRLIAQGFSRLIVAGGETSGAVVSALGIKAIRIGAEIEPGIPWTETLGNPRIALALKSGNFGGEDFFDKAFAMLP